MNLLAIQIALSIVLSFLTGLGLGWYVVNRFQKAAEEACRQELNLLREQQVLTNRAAHDLQRALDKAEEQKKRAIHLMEKSTDHGDFQKLRKKLEVAHKEITTLHADLKRREQQVVKLADISRTLKKQLELRQTRILKQSQESVVLLPTAPQMENDDLQAIEGITPEMAHKLHSMGIINYRQLAECSPDQQQIIQNLIGQETPLPLARWVRTAQQLFKVKYANLMNETHQLLPQSRTA